MRAKRGFLLKSAIVRCGRGLVSATACQPLADATPLGSCSIGAGRMAGKPAVVAARKTASAEANCAKIRSSMLARLVLHQLGLALRSSNAASEDKGRAKK